MNMQSVQGSDSWQQFMKLAQYAKVRNAGFEVPLAVKRTDLSAGKNRVPGNVETVVHSMKRLYDLNAPEKQKPVLGSRFDAYA